ncbi:MAG: tetratricopeptide (TPR) repeat protein [Rhodothermales bacterium]|jgi:tetratricopeptide (TPR) repeat protein
MKEQEPVEFYFRFAVVGICNLVALLVMAQHFFPKVIDLDELFRMLSAQQQQQELTPLQRLLEAARGRHNPKHGEPKKGDGGKRGGQQAQSQEHSGEGLSSTVVNKAQLSLRELQIAQQILVTRFGESRRDAWRKVRAGGGNGEFRDYEQKRYLNDLLWHDLAMDKGGPLVEAKLEKMSAELADSPYGFFEDVFNAGLGHLNAGDPKKAILRLEEAMEMWPAQDRTFGSVFLALLIAHAVNDDALEVFSRLPHFQDFYPDWFYVEVFIEDIDELHELYPDSALLWVVQGRLVQNVNDYATAGRCYSKALSVGMPPLGVTILKDWIREVSLEE